MGWDTLKTGWVGDIHLGHRSTPTSHILTNLYHVLNEDRLRELDILFIEGDVFDQLLTLDAEPVSPIRLWIATLLSWCAKHQTKVRVLKGTPSHDWGQPALFGQVNEELSLKADLRYYETIAIDTEEDLGLTVLYVPDEAKPTTAETQAVVEQLLKRKGLTQVDLACMHGYFAPQMPEALAHGAHDTEFYLSHVKYAIGIGHVHRYWKHEHIVASGSFDRIAHGEEEAKGMSVITLVKDKPEQTQFQFVENTNARSWVTVDCRDKPLEKAKARVIKVAQSLRPGSEVRIIARPDEAIAQALPFFTSEFPNLHWKRTFKDKGSKADVDEQLIELIPIEKKTHVFSITQDNVVSLLKERPLFMQDKQKAETAIAHLETVLAH